MAGFATWISKVRVKKNALKRCRRSNLRVEAILTSTLVKAESLLRTKEQQLLRRQHVKMEVYKTGSNYCKNTPKNTFSSQWDEKTCEVINSLNSFMWQLNAVKSPLQR
jgi:predicted small secreted protein